jgi:hypothetical protein
MTVTTTTAALLAWAFAASLFLNWYWSSKLADCRDTCDKLKRINESNQREYARERAIFVSSIVNFCANDNRKLPALNSKLWSRMQDLYDDPQLMVYSIPAQITTDHDDRPSIYWKVADINELDAYQIARMWCVGII